MKPILQRLASIALVLGSLIPSLARAYPVPTLTAEGQAMGFSLSTVVSHIGPEASFGVLGSVVAGDGRLLVNQGVEGKTYVFSNVDGQTGADALSSTTAPGFPVAMAYAGGSVWAGGGALTRLNNDGTIAQSFSGISAGYGLWTNPIDGHLITTGFQGLLDIDVSNASAPAVRVVQPNFFSDGLAVSLDGRYVYGYDGSIVSLADGSNAGSFGLVLGADGIGVIQGGNQLHGDLVVNTVDGRIVHVDAQTHLQTVIASGGGYGDFVSPDRSNGTLLVSSANNLLRLGCGPSCSLAAVPEPETYALMLAGLALVTGIAKRCASGRTDANRPS